MWSQVAHVAAVALAAAHPTVTVSPARALVDQPVDVRVVGLPPHRSVALVAKARDRAGVRWRSRLAFVSNARGVVDSTGACGSSGRCERAPEILGSRSRAAR
jgi:Acyl-CoA thioester hydrolase/BAAT N-terminal region